MLEQIEELYKYLLITLLVVYLINFAFFGEVTISFTVIALVIILEFIIHRHHIKKLNYAQVSIIGVVLLAGIAGTVYLFVLFGIFLDPLSLPAFLEKILLLAFVLICLYVLVYFLKRMVGRAIEKN